MGGRGGGRAPTGFVWPCPALAPYQPATAFYLNPAATAPHVGAYQHGVVYRTPAPTPDAPARAVGIRTPSPAAPPFQTRGRRPRRKLAAVAGERCSRTRLRRFAAKAAVTAGEHAHGVWAPPPAPPTPTPSTPAIAKEVEQKLYLSATTLAPPTAALAASQKSQPASQKAPEVELVLVSKKGFAHPARPGAGTAGKNKNVMINVADNDLFHYDVFVNPESKSRQTNREVLTELIKIHGKTSLGGKLPAYDGRKSIFTAGSLPFESEEFTVTPVDPEKKDKERAEREYKITIRIAGRTDLYHLQQFLCGRQRDMPQETIQVLDVVLSYVTVSRSFFSSTFGHRGDIGEGLECWRGYYQSLRPTQMGLSLNIDISATSFFKPVTVIQFVQEFLILRDVSWPLNDRDRVKIKRALQGLRVETNHQTDQIRRYKIKGLTNVPMSQLIFPVDERGTRMLVVQYFFDRYDYKLQHTNWPCLLSGSDSRPVYLPMEGCKIVEGQRYSKKLNDKQVTNILRATCQRPQQREQSIREMVLHNKYTEDKFAQEVRIKVCSDLALVPARVLPPPMLRYHDSGREKTCAPAVGQWNMINKSVCPRPVVDIQTATPNNIELALRDVHRRTAELIAQQGKEGQLQLLVVILPEVTGSCGKIKRVCETDLGFVSQCCLPRHASRPNKQYLENVALKINVKAGGCITVLERAFVRNGIPFVSEVQTIIFGADVAHPPPGEDSASSIAAVVASMDWPEITKYRGLVSAQPHRQDIIEDLFSVTKDLKKGTVNGGMIRELLIAFHRKAGRRPERIIFYRFVHKFVIPLLQFGSDSQPGYLPMEMVLHNKYMEDNFAQNFGINVCSELALVPACVLPPPVMVLHNKYTQDMFAQEFGIKVCPKMPRVMSSPMVLPSMDWPEIPKYRGLVSAQPLAQPQTQQIVRELLRASRAPQRVNVNGGIIKDLTVTFRKNTGRKPEKLIFRDGIIDGQFCHVLVPGTDAVQKARGSFEEGYLPAVNFMVNRSRHHTSLSSKVHGRHHTNRSNGRHHTEHLKGGLMTKGGGLATVAPGPVETWQSPKTNLTIQFFVKVNGQQVSIQRTPEDMLGPAVSEAMLKTKCIFDDFYVVSEHDVLELDQSLQSQNISRNSTIEVRPRTRGGTKISYPPLSVLQSVTFEDLINKFSFDDLFEERNLPTDLMGSTGPNKIRNGRSAAGREHILKKSCRQIIHKLFEMIHLLHLHGIALDGKFTYRDITYIPILDSYTFTDSLIAQNHVRYSTLGYERDMRSLGEILKKLFSMKWEDPSKGWRSGVYPVYVQHLLDTLDKMPPKASSSLSFKAFLRNHVAILSPGAVAALILEVHQYIRYQEWSLQSATLQSLGNFLVLSGNARRSWPQLATPVECFKMVYMFQNSYTNSRISWFEFLRNFLTHPTQKDETTKIAPPPKFTFEDVFVAFAYHFEEELPNFLCDLAILNKFNSTHTVESVFDKDWFASRHLLPLELLPLAGGASTGASTSSASAGSI